ncbi:MAG: energy-coupling factor transporter transmembrane component T [Eubacteriales bacterium]|jgi:energy-coupling factor transport system permease protein|nr:energy-coupling factor transporter transmembrane component T [Eubacteriales bacterium]MDD4104402.1 energy-coupling factor transporter transmembrane component T [Eubacteriales bacterium]MDD4709651.1 energy-coupling factor transporter transmembrane component T [Eubacteriales bacterium]NLO16382.1 energy-coupling factor transporter transmembrane protein EcfT [Clostridiales bacterium]
MLNDITLGQYYPADSFAHRLDPRTKILLSIVYIVSIFLVKSLFGYIPVVLYLFLTIKVSTVPMGMMVRSIRPLRILLLFTFVLNLFFGTGERILFQWAFLTIRHEGLMNALHFSLRLIFLVTGTSLLTLTTAPVVLTDGLERLVSPLRVIKFPAHEMAMMMTIALRFIPTLVEEAQKIMKAQTARGADFTSGNLKQRTKAMIPLLVPLFISAFRRAGDLAMAMEARCYHGGEGRTRLHVLKFRKDDAIAGISILVLMAVIILVEQWL